MSADAPKDRPRRARALLAVAASGAALCAALAADPAVRGGAGGGRGQPLSPQERAEIGASIESANAILQDLYASGGVPALLDELPYSTMLRHQVFRDLGLLRDSGMVLVLDEADLLPVEVVRTGADAVEALVYEEWNYMYQRGDTRVPLGPMRGLGQGFRYRLARGAGRWEVVGWDPEDGPRPERRGSDTW